MSSETVNVLIEAIDKASATIEAAASKLQGSLDGLEKKNQSLAEKQKSTEASAGNLVKGLNQVGVAAFSLYQSYDSMERSQVAADRANLNLQRSSVAAAGASGSVEMQARGKPPKGHLAADAQVNLAALAAQLPDTLKLQKGLTIEAAR